MTTLAVALKDEVRRLARKEIRALTGPTTRAAAQCRRDLARLKREIREQQKKIAALESHQRKRGELPPVAEDENGGARFSARSVKAQRRKTGMSAADYAKLVGVSALTIYNWETGKSRPRQKQLAALVALRGIGKREAQSKLELLKASASKPAGKAGAGRRRKS